MVRAVFDRSFIDEHGVRWVIDYKTSQHVGGGLEEFLEREVERYRPQLQRYAMLAQKFGPEPVRVGLYFPLMRAWREWAPNERVPMAKIRMTEHESHRLEDPLAARCADRPGHLLLAGARRIVPGVELKKMSELQDCVMQGRTNCSPVATDP